MKIIITGGSGFLGSKLTQKLLNSDTKNVIDKIIIMDVIEPFYFSEKIDSRISFVKSDLTELKQIKDILKNNIDTIFHLASVVSADAEENLDKAMKVNVVGILNLLNACRDITTSPKFIFTSSFAAFGGSSMPDNVNDNTKIVPQNTYGMTKAINELIVNDYTRKGYIDGRGARLPTIIIRPGRANKAASSFASGLFREPLSGKKHFLPVNRNTKIAVGGYNDAIQGLIQLSEIDRSLMGDDCTINFPNFGITVSEMINSLYQVTSGMPLGEIIDRPDESIQSICERWPSNVSYERAAKLGINKCSNIKNIITDYIGDYLE